MSRDRFDCFFGVNDPLMPTKTGEIEHFVLTLVGGDMDGQVLDSRSPVERERTVVEIFLG